MQLALRTSAASSDSKPESAKTLTPTKSIAYASLRPITMATREIEIESIDRVRAAVRDPQPVQRHGLFSTLNRR
jgi:hypothetical protein